VFYSNTAGLSGYIKDMLNKVIKIIKENKFLFLAGVSAFILVIAIVTQPRTTERPRNEPNYKKEEYVSVPEGTIELRVLDVYPPLHEEKIREPYTRFPFKFTFSEPVALNTAEVNVSPEMPITVTRDKKIANTLMVMPETEWESGIKYRITIKDTIKSINGNLLKSDYTHTFTVEKIEESGSRAF
jgi:hypothetical protein